jgi:sugar O-acyltransferase (sialic acid O-acetyltransferase NeuD family)
MSASEKKYLIVGASGFGREVLCCLLDSLRHQGIDPTDKIAFAETADFCANQKEINGYPVLIQDEIDTTNYNVIIAISDPNIRKRIAESLPEHQSYHTLIHPTAVVSEWVELGAGAIVTAGVILTTQIKIGQHAHLNLQTTIGHDCVIGDYFTTAPGARVNGNCTMGDAVYMGTNAMTKQGVSICSNTTIGMGAVVLKDIHESGTYIGCPAIKLK